MLCPKGHDSSELDFCSECGMRMGTAPAGTTAPAAPAPATPQTCPDCSLERSAEGGKFCEFCGYNFSTGASGALKSKTPEPPAAPAAVWEVVIEVDPSLRTEGSPAAPENMAPRRVRLTAESNLIGRTSEKRAIHPEIALDQDDAVSHRHALLKQLPNGSLLLRDIESSNGTRLNGTDLRPLTDVNVKAGDKITLGHWTRITLEAVPQA